MDENLEKLMWITFLGARILPNGRQAGKKQEARGKREFVQSTMYPA